MVPGWLPGAPSARSVLTQVSAPDFQANFSQHVPPAGPARTARCGPGAWLRPSYFQTGTNRCGQRGCNQNPLLEVGRGRFTECLLSLNDWLRGTTAPTARDPRAAGSPAPIQGSRHHGAARARSPTPEEQRGEVGQGSPWLLWGHRWKGVRAEATAEMLVAWIPGGQCGWREVVAL